MDNLADRLDFIHRYIGATNAASGSEVDANSNVTQKSIATLEAELYKPYTIAINRAMVTEKLEKLFGKGVAQDYETDLDTHTIYVHDETSLKPYCASITLYPFLLEGTKCIGGVSKAPKNLQSFCGGFVNLIYQVASNFAGAIATVEFLHCFDYFARKQYGRYYLITHKKEIEQEMQGVVYALNQPASARGDQSVFWNISVFDKPYMKEMFGEFYYPDGTEVNFDSLMELQKFFMNWFKAERHKELLTFPVVTASVLTTPEGYGDEDFVDFLSQQMADGHSFFVYMSDSVDSLASCCRLRNELADNTFSYSLGAGGVVTGSSQVITINVNRLIQDCVKGDFDYYEQLKYEIEDVQRYLIAHKSLYKEYIAAGLLPAYSAGFMDIDKQFLTIGLNGVVEAAEFLGFTISPNKEYKEWLNKILQLFTDCNKAALKKYHCRFNTEFVPAENLGVKNAKWDKDEGLKVTRDCYNSYFYAVEDKSLDILDKIHLYGKDVTSALDGGSALHLNLEHLLSKEQAKTLFDVCRFYGVPYWTFNVLCTICDSCGNIDAKTLTECPKCHSKDIEYGTRVIGYLKRIGNFSEGRQKEAGLRIYHKVGVK